MQMQMFLFWFVFFASSCFLVWSSFPGTGAVKIFSGAGQARIACPVSKHSIVAAQSLRPVKASEASVCFLFLSFFFTCFLRVGVDPTDFLFPVFDSFSLMQLD